MESFLNNFIVPYIIKNKLNPDNIFATQIDSLVRCIDDDEEFWINVVPAMWRAIRSVGTKI